MIVVLSLGISLQELGRDKVFFDSIITSSPEKEGVIWEVAPADEKVVNRIYRDIVSPLSAFYLIYPDAPSLPREVNLNFIGAAPDSITFVRLPQKGSLHSLWLSPQGKAWVVVSHENYSYGTKENKLTFRVKIEDVSCTALRFRGARLVYSLSSSPLPVPEREVYASLPDKTLIHLEQSKIKIDTGENLRDKIYEAGKDVRLFMRDSIIS